MRRKMLRRQNEISIDSINLGDYKKVFSINLGDYMKIFDRYFTSPICKMDMVAEETPFSYNISKERISYQSNFLQYH